MFAVLFFDIFRELCAFGKPANRIFSTGFILFHTKLWSDEFIVFQVTKILKMPSPKRDSGSKIAYTRWEPLEAATEDVEATSLNNNNNNNGNGSVPFHHFEQETEQQSTSKLRLSPRTLIINGRPPSSKRRSSEHHIKCWEWGVRILGKETKVLFVYNSHL